jgi:cyanophycinase-like exopeptidase
VTRLLTVMGSGETSPTMTKVHRDLIDRAAVHGPAVLLDTPVGFQENADDIAAKAVQYFRESVHRPIAVASWRSVDDGAVTYETMLARVADAGYVFAGPGSPSYALEQWRESRVPALLAEKLQAGGAVTFASAAAVTLGVVAVPVYEIYKVGRPPAWLPGLDLMGAAAGLPVAVIPHYDNAEGGNHDTRYCYLGERRLRLLESQLPEGAFVLGVDEHTAATFDLDAGTVTVAGLGVMTVREDGRATEFPSGTTVAIAALRSGSAGPTRLVTPVRSAKSTTTSPLTDEVARLEAAGGLAAVLELEQLLVDWSSETFSADEYDRARAVFRSMIVRLAEAEVDRRAVVAPVVDALLAVRDAARADRRWADADAVRDALLATGIEVNDGPEGTEWGLLS